jgi:hypothetical protein
MTDDYGTHIFETIKITLVCASHAHNAIPLSLHHPVCATGLR